jgi:hypothetical protein
VLPPRDPDGSRCPQGAAHEQPHDDTCSPGIGFHWTLIWAKFMAVRVSYATEERYEH